MPELFETQERTEEATAKHREDARARGQFTRSTDLSTAVVLLVIATVLIGFGPRLMRDMGREIVAGVQRLTVPIGGVLGGAEALRAMLLSTAKFVGPFLGFAAAAGIALHAVQAGGFFFVRDGIQFKPGKLDPTENLARILSMKSIGKLGGALFKFAIIVAVLVVSLRGRLDDVASLASMDLESAAPRLGSLLLTVFLRVTGALLVLGCADWVWQRWQHARDLRMSKQQVRDEQKNEDGDPALKRRMRDRIRRLIDRPLREAVGGATVVITNPTHFAVALEYVEGKSAAPTVVAKGVDGIAEEIKRIAREDDVPVIEQPPLARALFRDVQVGNSIPEPLYRAVAAVLAIVWRLREEKARRSGKPPAARAAAGGR